MLTRPTEKSLNQGNRKATGTARTQTGFDFPGDGPGLKLDQDLPWSYSKPVIQENLSRAKAVLSSLVNAALEGEDVMICKDGVPVVRLVPVRPILGEDPCRSIPELAISVGDEVMEPLDAEAWGNWVGRDPV